MITGMEKFVAIMGIIFLGGIIILGIVYLIYSKLNKREGLKKIDLFKKQ